MSEPQRKNNVEVKPTGSYFAIDKEGYVVNPASPDKIQEEWKPVINDIVNAYKKYFGSKLINVYIRGSVAKGEAIPNISDIDSFAYVNLTKEQTDKDWDKNIKSEIKEIYPFVEKVEFETRSLPLTLKDHILLNQSLCVSGDPLEVQGMKPGREMMLHAPRVEKRMIGFEKKLAESESEEKIKDRCAWFMKDTLRTGFELTMEKSKRYTRDLYLCYKDFSEYYPDKEPIMQEVLYYALNPTSDKEKVLKIKAGITPWLIEEARGLKE